MRITKVSSISGKTHVRDIPVTQDQFSRRFGGAPIQVAMSNLSPGEREFIKTGITPEEWEELLG